MSHRGPRRSRLTGHMHPAPLMIRLNRTSTGRLIIDSRECGCCRSARICSPDWGKIDGQNSTSGGAGRHVLRASSCPSRQSTPPRWPQQIQAKATVGHVSAPSLVGRLTTLEVHGANTLSSGQTSFAYTHSSLRTVLIEASPTYRFLGLKPTSLSRCVHLLSLISPPPPISTFTFVAADTHDASLRPPVAQGRRGAGRCHLVCLSQFLSGPQPTGRLAAFDT